jgi:hypothetical protein
MSLFAVAYLHAGQPGIRYTKSIQITGCKNWTDVLSFAQNYFFNFS